MRRESSSIVYLAIVVAIAVGLLGVAPTERARSQTATQQPDLRNGPPRVFGGPERKLYIGVPTRVPLTFDVRNVTSERWIFDLEIEVTNVSAKPIYYMDMFLFPVGFKSPQGYRIAYLLRYGRAKLINITEPVERDDIPIEPGAKHIFKISRSDAEGWEAVRGERAEPQKLELQFQGINFGDGTGFGPGGKPVNIQITGRTKKNRPPSIWNDNRRTSQGFLPASGRLIFLRGFAFD